MGWVREETWRSIPGYPNYLVSSHGRVQGPRATLKFGDLFGYKTVSLSANGTTKSFRVHRLVIEAFAGAPPFEGAIVAHNDGDRSNNRIDNLRWASARENQQDRVRHHTRLSGSRVHNAKLTESEIPTIRDRIRSGERYPRIAEDYGVSVSTICLISKGKIWKCATGAGWRVNNV